MGKEGNNGRIRPAVVIIVLCLCASVALIAAPGQIRIRFFSIASVLVTFLAAIKFAAFGILNYRKKRRLAGALWGVVAFFFLLLLAAEIQYAVENIHEISDTTIATDISNAAWKPWQENGVGMNLPAGWEATAGGDGMVLIDGMRGEHLIIWPLFGGGEFSDAFATNLVEAMTRKLVGDVQMRRAVPSMSHAVGSEGSDGVRRYSASLAWSESEKGCAGIYMLASAPREIWESTAEVFPEIMNGLTLRGSGTAADIETADRPAISYTTFTDPTEGAFTAEVPAGWQVIGGVARFNASDVRPWLRLLSPDGTMSVFMGDPNIPSMLVPNRPLAGLGFTEGMTYNAGYNQVFLLKSYAPGMTCARQYAENNLAGNCNGGVTADFRDLPELAAAINTIFRYYNSPYASQRLDVGEIAIDCPDSDRAQYVLAGTLLSQINTYQAVFSMWVVNYLYGFDAPRSEAASALEITRRLAGSFRVTETWARMNLGLQAGVSAIISETGAAISRTVSEGFWNAQRAHEKSTDRFGKAILGVEDTIDPLTGENIRIVSGADHAWIDHQGNVIGTRTDTSPGIDYRKLFKLD